MLNRNRNSGGSRDQRKVSMRTLNIHWILLLLLFQILMNSHFNTIISALLIMEQRQLKSCLLMIILLQVKTRKRRRETSGKLHYCRSSVIHADGVDTHCFRIFSAEKQTLHLESLNDGSRFLSGRCCSSHYIIEKGKQAERSCTLTCIFSVLYWCCKGFYFILFHETTR